MKTIPVYLLRKFKRLLIEARNHGFIDDETVKRCFKAFNLESL